MIEEGTMTALRMQFLFMAVIIFVGIFLTGFQRAHWFLYFPVVMLLFAGISGVCPGLLLWKKLGLK
jgi:hypothetical protein